MKYTISFEMPDALAALEWSKQEGEEVELGVKTMASDKFQMKMAEEMKQAIGTQMARAMATGLVDGSLVPLVQEIFKEYDPDMRATELSMIVNGAFYPFILPKALALQERVKQLEGRLFIPRWRLMWRALRGRV